jgi:hypothetical protein
MEPRSAKVVVRAPPYLPTLYVGRWIGAREATRSLRSIERRQDEAAQVVDGLRPEDLRLGLEE